MNPIKNYFSLWIANFGVDPLFSILFFLFLPAFFFLKFLLHLVCIVFDAMTVSLSYLFKIKIINSPVYLPILAFLVKIFIVLSPIKVYANGKISNEINHIFMAKGEQEEIDANQMTRYSVGNKEVIKHLFVEKNRKILIKGLSVGFSDLILWKEKTKTTYHIYVLSKKEQLNKMQLAETFKRTGLNTSIQGSLLVVTGTIKEYSEYLIVQNILKNKYKNLLTDIKIDKNLRNHIFGEIYAQTYNLGATKTICFNTQVNIDCSIQGLDLKNSHLQRLAEKFNIKFQNSLGILKDTNYMAYFKIIQVEHSRNDKRKIGISKISSPLVDLINKNYVSLIEGESIHLSQFNANATLLAEPQTSLILEEKAILSLGGELPYNNIQGNNQNTTTQWKFYGLKINTVLKNLNGRPFLKYNTELTAPEEQNISGSKGQSGIYITKNKYVKLFEVGYKIKNHTEEGVPLLNKIPLLKYLFTSDDKSESYKQIICYVKVEEI